MALAAATPVLVAAPGPSAAWRHGGIGAGRAQTSGIRSPNDVEEWLRSERRALVWEAEGIESSVALVTHQGLAFVINGKIDGHATVDAATQVMSGLLGAALQPRAPARALVIGLGTRSSAGWLAALTGVERVDVVELEPAVLDVARACRDVNRDVMRSPAVSVSIGDAREVLLTSRETYPRALRCMVSMGDAGAMLTPNDVIVFNESSQQSIATGRILKLIDQFAEAQLMYVPTTRQLIIAYRMNGETGLRHSLIWDRESNTWGKRDYVETPLSCLGAIINPVAIVGGAWDTTAYTWDQDIRAWGKGYDQERLFAGANGAAIYAARSGKYKWFLQREYMPSPNGDDIRIRGSEPRRRSTRAPGREDGSEPLPRVRLRSATGGFVTRGGHRPHRTENRWRKRVMRSPRLSASILMASLSTAGTLAQTRPAPPASDPRAIEIAGRVMDALGGQAAWRSTHYLRFTFAVDREGKTVASRTHTWDKWTGNYRLEGTDRDGKPFVVLMNLNSRQRKARKDGSLLEGAELATQLEAANGAWVNDTYWLLMPYNPLRPPLSQFRAP